MTLRGRKPLPAEKRRVRHDLCLSPEERADLEALQAPGEHFSACLRRLVRQERTRPPEVMDRVRAAGTDVPGTDRELLLRLLTTTHGWVSGPRWKHVSKLSGHGSTVSYELCIEAGLDPDETR